MTVFIMGGLLGNCRVHSSMYCVLSTPAFFWWQNWEVVTKTWLKISTIWALTEKVCDPWSRYLTKSWAKHLFSLENFSFWNHTKTPSNFSSKKDTTMDTLDMKRRMWIRKKKSQHTILIPFSYKNYQDLIFSICSKLKRQPAPFFLFFSFFNKDNKYKNLVINSLQSTIKNQLERSIFWKVNELGIWTFKSLPCGWFRNGCSNEEECI